MGLSPSTMSLRLLSRNFARSFRGSLQSSSRTFVQTRFYSEESGKRVGLTSVLDHATGEEKEELLTELEGKELYEQYLSGPFGTIENPVIVPSVMHTRIVGCLGGDGDSAHDLLWHEVKKDKPTICAECGQVSSFKPMLTPRLIPLRTSPRTTWFWIWEISSTTIPRTNKSSGRSLSNSKSPTADPPKRTRDTDLFGVFSISHPDAIYHSEI